MGETWEAGVHRRKPLRLVLASTHPFASRSAAVTTRRIASAALVGPTAFCSGALAGEPFRALEGLGAFSLRGAAEVKKMQPERTTVRPVP